MTESSDITIFRRMVIGLLVTPDSRESLAIAADFARRFNSELLAVFHEDIRLIEWCASQRVRHHSRTASGARTVSPERMLQDFSAAAAVARSRLLKLAQSLGLDMRFEVSRGEGGPFDPGAIEPGDLLAVIEPADPLARLSHPFASVLQRIAAASAPVLYVPHGAAPRAGPVISELHGENGNERQMVERIVRILGEELITAPDADPMRLISQPARERLIVMSRRSPIFADMSAFTALVTARRAPILVVGNREAPGVRETEPGDDRGKA